MWCEINMAAGHVSENALFIERNPGALPMEGTRIQLMIYIFREFS